MHLDHLSYESRGRPVILNVNPSDKLSRDGLTIKQILPGNSLKVGSTAEPGLLLSI